MNDFERIAFALASALALGLAASSVAARGPAFTDSPIASELDAASATASVIVLYANNSGKGIDERIGDMNELKEPPFSAYDTYELLDKSDVSFSTAEAGALKLPNQGQLSLKLNKSGGGKYDLKLSITKPGGKKFVDAEVKARKGEIFFVAGPKYRKGILVLGIRVGGK